MRELNTSPIIVSDIVDATECVVHKHVPAEGSWSHQMVGRRFEDQSEDPNSRQLTLLLLLTLLSAYQRNI